MKKVQIWHNPHCRKSREGLNFLRDKGIKPEIYEYLKSGFSAKELGDVISKTGQSVKDFIRTQETDYKELGLKGKELTIEAFSEIAVKRPKLLQRPIVVIGEKAVLALPANKIEEII